MMHSHSAHHGLPTAMSGALSTMMPPSASTRWNTIVHAATMSFLPCVNLDRDLAATPSRSLALADVAWSRRCCSFFFLYARHPRTSTTTSHIFSLQLRLPWRHEHPSFKALTRLVFPFFSVLFVLAILALEWICVSECLKGIMTVLCWSQNEVGSRGSFFFYVLIVKIEKNGERRWWCVEIWQVNNKGDIK